MVEVHLLGGVQGDGEAGPAVPELGLVAEFRGGDGECLLRDAVAEEETRRSLRSLAPLTLKPWIVVANVEEGGGVPPGLPDGAVDSGLRSPRWHLWTGGTDVIWMVTPTGGVEAWPKADPLSGCA